MSAEAEDAGFADIVFDPDSNGSASPELVFGLVGALGCNIDAVQEVLSEELSKVGYNSSLIHLTKYIEEVIPEVAVVGAETFSEKIKKMNDLVAESGAKDFLAKIAIAKIISIRTEENRKLKIKKRVERFSQLQKHAFVIRQLKRSQEIDLLRKVYGRKFIQISVVVSEGEQLESAMNIIGRESPEKNQSDREEAARRLVSRDRDEADVQFGQRIIDAYHSADFFVGGSLAEISSQMERFIQALFGSNYISPTKDEVGSYYAKAASLRTLDLSRQVGAAITNVDGDIISLGTNEVPRPGGGNYWCDDPFPQRDIERGLEANKLETTRIIHDFVHALSGHKDVTVDPVKLLNDREFAKIIKETLVSDITEFGRMTHAEMSALADAARLGRSTKGATIYVTTFPCHNCAKHLVASGVSRIVYIEPYPKSKAFELSRDALTTDKSSVDKVLVQHFSGISPRRFRDIFEKTKKRADDKNKIKKWHFEMAMPMVEDKFWTHTIVEKLALADFDVQVGKVKKKFSSK
ncbi:deoxycytidylate deaminase [Nitratireductor aquimarinus]|uniref:anti-phage dCTP deaminase n=1 Tax=Nitratireductor aquimarinus TaxID=889300 RepID=UPI001A8D2479|nr:anti-phage dCTP deaminase [Nitratireductor aquimarinus]MBN8243272.1 deoxycytidylate deaminase [Nitratireductor aquimarinus]MBY6131173.1 deoxycytidylate deaminase [Nitratireductor aquimarinus]MCA1302071.1 deoxycytidylate deaminase [Nitratireductor aquimarinus]